MALLILLVCLSTYRLTRLLVADTITEPWRLAVENRMGSESSWAYLVNCPWCTGVWVAAAVALVTDLLVSGGLVAPVLVAGSAAAVTGILSSIEPD